MTKNKQRKRHVPERTCIACRAKLPKRELVRVVRSAEGKIQVDETGKQAGRGAYLCHCRACWETALKRGNLSRALRAPLSQEDKAALQEYATSLPET